MPTPGGPLKESTGFSDVDQSGRSEALVEYLGRMAQLAAERRREGYEMLRLKEGSAVLDVGCGAGEVCVELAKRVGPLGKVSGVDLSETMVEATRRAVGEAGLPVEVRVASVYALPFPDGVFDAVRAERVFQHLDDPEAALAEMLRVTRAGGRVMVIDPDHGQVGLALDDPAHQPIFEAIRHALLRTIVNPHSGTRLRSMFVRAGLSDVAQVAGTLEFGHPDFVRAIFLDDRLAWAIDAGEITRDQADRFVAELQRRQRDGTFFASAVGYRVVGTKP